MYSCSIDRSTRFVSKSFRNISLLLSGKRGFVVPLQLRFNKFMTPEFGLLILSAAVVPVTVLYPGLLTAKLLKSKWLFNESIALE